MPVTEERLGRGGDSAKDFWRGYVSNTAAGTGNNYFLRFGDLGVHTFRCRIRPLYFGDLLWRFWFRNAVDSTFDDGSVSTAGTSGGHWKIVSACVRPLPPDGENTDDFFPVTFDGKADREVLPGESFWSDPRALSVRNGQQLEFSWAIEAESGEEKIPMSPDSQILCMKAKGNHSFDRDGEPFRENPDAPKPNLFAVKMEKCRMCFLGDSITQGLHTGVDEYEFWAAKIAEGIKAEYSCWNLGLGFARASDAAGGGPWLEKAEQCETVALCLGVNDLLHGNGTADTVLRDLRKIVGILLRHNENCRIFLFTLPPLDEPLLHRADWDIINGAIRSGAVAGTEGVFDIAKVLGCPPPQEYRSRFGGLHPNGEGGTAVSQAFFPFFRSQGQPEPQKGTKIRNP